MDSKLKTELEYEIVYDAFFLYSLLLDYYRHRKTDISVQLQPFTLPHRGDQDRRLDAALEARNLRFAGNGRKAWTHACDDCFKVFTGPDGSPCTCVPQHIRDISERKL